MTLELNGREIEARVSGTYNEELILEDAYYTDTEEELSDAEVDQVIEENYEDLNFELYERAIMRAEAYYEGDR